MLAELVAASRWNQIESDWRLFLDLGRVYVIRDGHARIVASGAVLPMGGEPNGVAWISMILVLPAQRGAGLGKAVFAQCLREIQRMDRVPMLDATPAGEALYRQFGFQALWRSARWRRQAVGSADAGPHWADLARFPRAAARDVDAVRNELIDRDALALGFRREAVLGAMMRRPDTVCRSNDGACAMVRAGRVAHQVGPLLSDGEGAAAELLETIASESARELVIDVPDDRPRMEEALRRLGFLHERRFARMALVAPGQHVPEGRLPMLHAIAGPEFA